MKQTSKTKGSLLWLTDWANCAQNFTTATTDHRIAQKLLTDDSLVAQLTALYNKQPQISNIDDAQNAIKNMLADCVIIARLIVAKRKPGLSMTPPTRTEHIKELRVLAGDIKSVQQKLKGLDKTMDKASSVEYLTARHQAGNPTKYSQWRLPSLRLDRPIFDMVLTLDHLLSALHDDIEETAANIERTIPRKRQTRGSDPLAAAMIDAVGRQVRSVIGRDTKPEPTLLVMELSRMLLTAHGYDKIPNESTVRSRLKNLSNP